MIFYKMNSIEKIDNSICMKYTDLDNHNLICDDCQKNYGDVYLSHRITSKLLGKTTICPFCGKELQVKNAEKEIRLTGILAVVAGKVSGKYRNIDIIEDLRPRGYGANVVARNTYQVPVSIKELSSMMEVYGLIRIGDMWIDLNFLDKTVISANENYCAVFEFKDIHFREGRSFISIDNKKVFRDLIKNKIYLRANLSKMNVEFYEKYYKPYEETMKEKYPEIVLLKLMDEDF